MKWRIVHILASLSSVMNTLLVLLAVLAFFFWPYAPSEMSVEELFILTKNDPFGAFICLDPAVLICTLLLFPVYLSFYVELKKISESLSAIAFLTGIISVILMVIARPIMEVFAIAKLYDSETDMSVKEQYVISAKILMEYFHGTAWFIATLGVACSSLISCLLMLKSASFRKITAWVGIFSSFGGLMFWLPYVGLIVGLFLFGTVGGVIFCFLVAFDLWKLSQTKDNDKRK